MQVMHSVHSKLRNIVGQDLRAVHSKDSLKQSVLLVLDCLCGMAEAARVDSAPLLFSLLCPAASDAVTLLGNWPFMFTISCCRLFWIVTLPMVDRGAKYCFSDCLDVSVCLSRSVLVYQIMQSVHGACSRGLALFWWHCKVICYVLAALSMTCLVNGHWPGIGVVWKEHMLRVTHQGEVPGAKSDVCNCLVSIGDVASY